MFFYTSNSLTDQIKSLLINGFMNLPELNPIQLLPLQVKQLAMNQPINGHDGGQTDSNPI